jgi:tRNA threonylcarbamoyladenosine biosynthesis protein TsaB
MLTLALEQSGALCSAALLRDGGTTAEDLWTDDGGRSPEVFRRVPALLAAARVAPADIERYAVGLGPGAFAALRSAISLCQGMALPGSRPVIGVASAAALAWETFIETGRTTVTVIGDARRARFWWAAFELDGRDARVPAGEYRLATGDELPSILAATSAVVSPHWERVGPAVVAAATADVHVIRESRHPHARTIAALAARELQPDAGRTPPAPVSPIYVHPPVFVEPRFPPRDTAP